MDEYIDGFQDLIDWAGYQEGLAIVIKFRHGLQCDIQDIIAQIPTGHPSDSDPEAWYKAALCCTENREANATFYGRLQSSAPLNRTTTVLSLLKPSTSVTVPPLPPPTSALVPMDIDVTNLYRMVPPTCH